MTVKVEATVDGLGGLNAALQRMAALGQKPRPIFKAIANYGESSTRMRFRNQAGPDGARWKPSLRVQQSGGKTLVKSSMLLRSITSRADNSSAEWGTNRKYAAMMQEGGVIKAKNAAALRFRLPNGHFVTVKKVTIPARPFVGVNAEDGREILRLTTAAIDDAAQSGKRGGAYAG